MFNLFKRKPVVSQVAQEKFVSCETCKHLVRERDAKIVSVVKWGFWSVAYFKSGDLFYCPEHQPAYDEIRDEHYYKNIPAHQVEVTEDGKLVK